MDPWFPHAKKHRPGKFRLFCLPYAGGGASVFRGWAERLPPTLELWPVHLPGRESRIGDPAIARALPLVEALIPRLRPYLNVPYAFFGHSMGGLLAFELLRRISQEGLPMPVRVIVSARQAPHLPFRSESVHELDDAKFVASVRDLNGTPEEVLNEPELLALVLPTLRADFALCETYTYQPGPTPDCILSPYGGLEDSHVHREDLEAWRTYATHVSPVRMFPGGHFFLHTARAQLLHAIAGELAPHL